MPPVLRAHISLKSSKDPVINSRLCQLCHSMSTPEAVGGEWGLAGFSGAIGAGVWRLQAQTPP